MRGSGELAASFVRLPVAQHPEERFPVDKDYYQTTFTIVGTLANKRFSVPVPGRERRQRAMGLPVKILLKPAAKV